SPTPSPRRPSSGSGRSRDLAPGSTVVAADPGAKTPERQAAPPPSPTAGSPARRPNGGQDGHYGIGGVGGDGQRPKEEQRHERSRHGIDDGPGPVGDEGEATGQCRQQVHDDMEPGG